MPLRASHDALPIPPPIGTVHWLPKLAFQFVICGLKVRYHWGYVMEKKEVDIPVPKGVKITPGSAASFDHEVTLRTNNGISY
jgi:hypothetical protein